MFEGIAVILFLIWLVMFVAGYTLAGKIHFLLLVAAVLFVIGLVTKKRGTDEKVSFTH